MGSGGRSPSDLPPKAPPSRSLPGPTPPSPSLRSGNTEALPGTIEETIGLIEEAGGQAFGLAADLEDPAARDGLVDAVVDRTGRIDIVVNNAGFADYSVVESMSLETFDRTVEHYLKTPFVLTKAAVPPHMRRQGGRLDRQHRLGHRSGTGSAVP